MKRCFLYPGQGAQYPGMCKDLWEASGNVKELFSRSSKQTGKNLTELLFEGSEDDLKETENTQIAVTLANISAATYLTEAGVACAGCAGFSLGEYSALFDAGIIGEADIFRVVQKRGEIMAEVANGLGDSTGRPGMAAVLGLDLDEAMPVLDKLRDEKVYLANHSSPTQIVIAGPASGLDTADALFEEAGAMRYVVLKVSGPFHSPLMEDARVELESFLNTIQFEDPKKPVYANVTGSQIHSGDEAKELCVRQIVSPVQWVKTEGNLLSQGYEQYIEVGPGRVLSGLWKSFNKLLKCNVAGTIKDIEALA